MKWKQFFARRSSSRNNSNATALLREWNWIKTYAKKINALHVHSYVILNISQEGIFETNFWAKECGTCNTMYAGWRRRKRRKKEIAQAQRTICQNRLLVEMRLIMIYGGVLPDERFRCVLWFGKFNLSEGGGIRRGKGREGERERDPNGSSIGPFRLLLLKILLDSFLFRHNWFFLDFISNTIFWEPRSRRSCGIIASMVISRSFVRSY